MKTTRPRRARAPPTRPPRRRRRSRTRTRRRPPRGPPRRTPSRVPPGRPQVAQAGQPVPADARSLGRGISTGRVEPIPRKDDSFARSSLSCSRALVVAAPASTAAGQAAQRETSLELAVVQQVNNAVRVAHGLRPLTVSPGSALPHSATRCARAAGLFQHESAGRDGVRQARRRTYRPPASARGRSARTSSSAPRPSRPRTPCRPGSTRRRTGEPAQPGLARDRRRRGHSRRAPAACSAATPS